jgi:hypothetical protein
VWSEAVAPHYAYVGGIAGHLQILSASADTATRITLERCYAAGVVGGDTAPAATNLRVGGLVAYATRAYAKIDILNSVALQPELYRSGANGHRIYGASAAGSGAVSALTAAGNAGYDSMRLVSASGALKATPNATTEGAQLALADALTATPYATAGWDFASTWAIPEGKGFPYLRYQSAPATVSSASTNTLTLDLPAGATALDVYKVSGHRRGYLATVAVEPAAACDLDVAALLLADGDTVALACRQQGRLVASYPVQATVQVSDVPASSITLDRREERLTYPATLALKATVSPASSNHKAVTWTSTNPEVATVSNGVVASLKGGVAGIVAHTDNGLTDTCAVTVTVPVTGVTVAPRTPVVEVGKTVQLTAAVLPAQADNAAVSWHSTDEATATVDNGGLVAGLAGAPTGTPVYIVATTADGGFRDTAVVSVVGAATGVEAARQVAVGLYPNPVAAGADVALALPDGAAGYTVALYGVGGAQLATFRSPRTLKAPAQPGLYLLVVTLPDGKAGAQKLLVK